MQNSILFGYRKFVLWCNSLLNILQRFDFSGFHTLPSFIWTEDYQIEMIEETTKAFDILRLNHTGFVGEMIWNFADFMTTQDITPCFVLFQSFATRGLSAIVV